MIMEHRAGEGRAAATGAAPPPGRRPESSHTHRKGAAVVLKNLATKDRKAQTAGLGEAVPPAVHGEHGQHRPAGMP
jgi:hypothetical protein